MPSRVSGQSEDGKKEFRLKKNDIVYFVVNTKDMAGKSIDFDLSDIKMIYFIYGKHKFDYQLYLT